MRTITEHVRARSQRSLGSAVQQRTAQTRPGPAEILSRHDTTPVGGFRAVDQPYVQNGRCFCRPATRLTQRASWSASTHSRSSVRCRAWPSSPTRTFRFSIISAGTPVSRHPGRADWSMSAARERAYQSRRKAGIVSILEADPARPWQRAVTGGVRGSCHSGARDDSEVSPARHELQRQQHEHQRN